MTKSFSDRVSEAKANHGTITPAELKEKLAKSIDFRVYVIFAWCHRILLIQTRRIVASTCPKDVISSIMTSHRLIDQ